VSHNESLPPAINLFSKLLKTKIFISQKFLDTPLFRLIRFRQKVLTVFCPVGTILPKREGRPLPGWPFCLKSNHRSSICSRRRSEQKPNRGNCEIDLRDLGFESCDKQLLSVRRFVQEFDQPISGWLISSSESRPLLSSRIPTAHTRPPSAYVPAILFVVRLEFTAQSWLFVKDHEQMYGEGNG